jgi:YbbR domain-containing protein
MLRMILDNLGSMLLSLLLAVMVWLVAITQGNPLREGRFPPGGLPIEVVGLPPGEVLFDPVSDRVSVMIRAPQNSWDALTSSNFRVFIDLSGLSPGIHDVPVQVRCPECSQRRVSVLGTSPDKISVRLDKYQEKKMDVRIEVLDNPALGYSYQIPIVTPSQVTISGPEVQVDQVTRVVGRIFLQDAKTDVERQVSVFALDNQNRPVAKVDVSPATVNVRVPITERRGFKEVAVKVVTEGTPAPGYYLSNITVTPPTLTVFGTPVLLDKAPGVLETEPVSISDAKATVERRVGLKVPDGISILGDEQSVLVRLEISAVQSAQTLEVKPIERGLGEGLQATLSPNAIQVILFGPVPELEQLKPTDVQVIIDLAGLSVGTSKVTPQVVKPESLQVKSIVPEQIEVVITAAPTPEPTPTPRVR